MAASSPEEPQDDAASMGEGSESEIVRAEAEQALQELLLAAPPPAPVLERLPDEDSRALGPSALEVTLPRSSADEGALAELLTASADVAESLGRLRRSGPLAELAPPAQTLLLGGTLFEYAEAGAAVDVSQQRVAPLGDVSLPLAEESAAGEESSRLSQLRHLSATARSFRHGAMRSVGSSFLLGDSATENSLVGDGLDGGVGFWQDSSSVRLGGWQNDGPNVTDSQMLSVVSEAPDDEGFVSVNANLFGATLASDATFNGAARTIYNETLPGDEGHFAAVLRRVALEPEFDRSLVQTARRLLQLGAVLTGQRLSEEEIQALPKVRFELEEEQSCAICLEQYSRGELLTALRCNHFFHVECLARWFQRSAQCPLCRADCE